MGGQGSGSWYRWDKKQTVDDGLSMDINKLVRDGLIVRRHAAGSLRWTNTRTGEETASMGFILEPLGEDSLIFRVNYTITGRDGDKQSFDYPIVLQTTRPHYGGRRWWLTCPLVKNGIPCERRVGRLYLPPGGKYFGCRHCYNLTYRSCQESDKRINQFMKNPAAIKALAESGSLMGAFLALKAIDRLEKKFLREERRWQSKQRGRPRKTT